MLTSDDFVTIAPEVIKLANEIGVALSPDSDGGKRITKAEIKGILRQLRVLGETLAKDLAD